MPGWKNTKNETSDPKLNEIQADSERELDNLRQFVKRSIKNESMTPAMKEELKTDLDHLNRQLRQLEKQAKSLVLNKKIPEEELVERRIAQAHIRKELIEDKFEQIRLKIKKFLPVNKASIREDAPQGAIQRKRRGAASIAPIGDYVQKSRFKKSSNDPVENEFRQNQEESESLLQLLNSYRYLPFRAIEIHPAAKLLESQVRSGFEDLDKRLSSYDAELAELAKAAENLVLDTKTPLDGEQKKDLAERRRNLSQQRRDLLFNHYNAIGLNIERLNQIEERYFPEIRELTTFRDTQASIQQESIQTFNKLEKEFVHYKFGLQESGLSYEPEVSTAIANCEKLLKEMSNTYQNYLELVKSTGHKTISSENYAQMMLAKDQMDDLEKRYNSQKKHLDDVSTATKMQKKMAVMQNTLKYVNAIKQNFRSSPILQELQSLLSDTEGRLKISRTEEEVDNAYSRLQAIINDASTNQAKANPDNEFEGRENVLSGIGAITFDDAKLAIERRNLLFEPFEFTDNPDNETAERLLIYLTKLAAVNEFDRHAKAHQSLKEIRAEFNKQFPDIHLSHGNSSFTYNNKAHEYQPNSSFGEAVNAYAVARQTIDSALENGDQQNVNYTTQWSNLKEAQAALNKCIEHADWQARIAEVKAAEAAKAANEKAAEEARDAEEIKAKAEAEADIEIIVEVINKEMKRIKDKHGNDDPRISKLENIRDKLKPENPDNTKLTADDIMKNINSALSSDNLKDLSFSKRNSLLRFVTQKILLPLANLFIKKPELFDSKTEKELRSARKKVQEKTETPSRGR